MQRADVESTTQRRIEDARVHDTGVAQEYREPTFTECVEALYKRARVDELAAVTEA